MQGPSRSSASSQVGPPRGGRRRFPPGLTAEPDGEVQHDPDDHRRDRRERRRQVHVAAQTLDERRSEEDPLMVEPGARHRAAAYAPSSTMARATNSR